MAPTITSVTPVSGDNDVNRPITVLGSGFVNGAIVRIGSVQCDNIIFLNSNYLTAEVPANVDPELYDITVVNPDTTYATETLAYRVTLPLPYPPFTFETYPNIVTRILANSAGNWSRLQGSYFRDLVNAFGYELALAYMNANIAFQLMFIETTNGGYLDLRALEFGVFRNQATKAVGSVTVTGVNGTVIPIGTRFSTSVVSGSLEVIQEFETTAEATIVAGTAVIPVTAVLAGVQGNVEANRVNMFVDIVSGLYTVNNPAPMTGAIDRETDNDFRERFLRSARNPLGGGNKADYETWALEVDGVGSATVLPLWAGPGTVKVLITDINGLPATAGLITDVQNYISPAPGTGEGKAPIGATVTIDTPATVNINVAVAVTVNTAYDGPTVRSAVQTALQDYITSLKVGEDVVYARTANTIFNVAGVVDYTSLTVNGGTANIAISDSQKAVPNTITVT